jgi:uncharacterized protein YjcR
MSHHHANGNPTQPARSVGINAKTIAYELGIKPNSFRQWIRRQGKRRRAVQWCFSKRQAAEIIAKYNACRPP